MPQTVDKPKPINRDEGVETGLKKSYPGKIEAVINSVLHGETGPRFKEYVKLWIMFRCLQFLLIP